jgi:putative membrane protein
MVRASTLLTADEKRTVEAAIAEAEKRTSGEIVPVVATRSGRYDRAEDVVGVVVGLLAVAAFWLRYQDVRIVEAGEWGSAPRLTVGLLAVLVVFALGFVGGAALATRFPILAIPLVGKGERREEVARRAREAFHDLRVRGTRGATGILIYLSLLERMVCVLGDRAIGERLDQAAWDDVRDRIVDGLRRGRPAEGLRAGIARAGELLAQHFPVAPGDANELVNELRVID